MKKKLLLLVPLLVVVVLVVVMLVLRSMLPPERLVALAEPRLEAALGREVEIGKASLRFWPLGVRLENVHVQANQGFESPLLLELGSLRLDLRLLPLLRRSMDVRSLVLERLQLVLEQDAKGRWNFERATAGAAAPAAPATHGGSPLALRIRSLTLRESSLQISMAPRDLELSIPLAAEMSLDLDRALEHVGVRGWIESRGVTAEAASRHLPAFDVRLEPELQANVAARRAHIDALRLQLQEFVFEMEGDAALEDGRPVVQLHTRSNSFELKELLALVPESSHSVEASGTAQLNLSIDVPASGSSRMAGSFSLERGRLRAAEWPATLENIELRALLSGDSLEVTRLDAALAGSPLHVQGSVCSLLDPTQSRYDVTLRTQLGLAALTPLLQQAVTAAATVDLQGQVEADLRAHGRLAAKSLPSLEGPLHLREVRLQAPALAQAVSLEATLHASGTQLQIEAAHVESGDSQIDASGTLFLALPPETPRLVLHGHTPFLDVDALLSRKEPPAAGSATGGTASPQLLPALPQVRVELVLDADQARVQQAELHQARLSWRSDPDRFHLDLKAQSLQQSDLTLRSCQGSLDGTPAVASGPLTAGSATIGKIEATKLQGELHLEGTQVQLKNVRAQTYDGSLQGAIAVDLSDPAQPKQQLDLNMEGVQLSGLLSDLFRAGGLVVGTLSGKSSWSATGTGAATIRKQLNGEGQGIAINGRLREMPLLSQLSGLLGVPSLSQLQYKELGFEFTVQEGQVRLPRMQLQGSDADASVDGRIGLDGALDLAVNLRLSEGLTRQALQKPEARALGKLFTDSQGRLVLDFDVGGSLKAPKVRADLQATAARSGLRSLGEEELKRLLGNLAPQPERAKEEIGRSLKDAVRGLFEPKTAKKDSTAKP